MATEILSVGTTGVTSADVVVTGQITAYLKVDAGSRVGSDVLVDVYVKDDAARYYHFAALHRDRSSVDLEAGTYRFVRKDGASCGVFYEAAGISSMQGSVASGTADSGNPVKVGGVFNSTFPLLTNGQRGDAQVDSRSRLIARIVGNDYTGVDGVGNNALTSVTGSGTTDRLLAVAPHKHNGNGWDRDRKPNATSRILSAAASTNATSAKASAGDLFNIQGYNAAAAVRYLKLYNKASAPVVGTDTPVKTLALPPTAAFAFDLGPYYFATGIAYALTTGSADADTGALTAGDILGLNLDYI